jgi:hypothetical protein
MTMVVAWVALAVAVPALAQSTQPVRIAGKLAKIDGKALTITADDGSGDVTIMCTDATKFRRDGAQTDAKLADLAVGQMVRAYYNKADNTANAVIIAKAP